MTDRTRRLLIRRFELLALGSILVDLAEDLVPLRYQLFDAIANLVFHYLSPFGVMVAWRTLILSLSELVVRRLLPHAQTPAPLGFEEAKFASTWPPPPC